MSRKIKKTLAVFLAVSVVSSYIPVSVYATENNLFSDGSETESSEVFESGTDDTTIPEQVESIPAEEAGYEIFTTDTAEDEIVGFYNEIQEQSENPSDEELPDAEAVVDDISDEDILSAGGTSGVCGDNLTWQLSSGTLTISGSGPMYNNQPWSSIKSSIKSVIIGNNVTFVGEYSFEDCDSLRSVTIGSGVTEIGYKAFYDCDSLTSLTVPDNVTVINDRVFQDCDSLNSVKIGNGVTILGSSAFENCDSLVTLSFGTNITKIDSYAFYDCDNLTSVVIPGMVQSIGNCAFTSGNNIQKVVIPNSVTSIGERAFEDCDNLSDLSIGSNVATIGYKAFYDCDLIPRVVIPDKTTSIGDRAFQDCDSITSVTIGKSVTYVGSSSFENCDSLSVLILGGAVEKIGSYAFYDCDSLGTVTIPSLTKSIGNYAFDSCDSLQKIIIGNSVETVGEYCFRGCTKLSSLTIGNSVDSIGYRAFSGCSSLTSLTIPDSVTEIGSRAFQDCSQIVSVNTGNGLITIGSSAFENCDSLRRLTIGTSVITIESNAFYDCDSLTVAKIPANVINLNNYAFAECDSLVQATIGNGTVKIGEGAFKNCSSLTAASIGSAVTTIGYRAFSGCALLKTITIPGKVTSIGNYAFDSTGLSSIYFTGRCPNMDNNTFSNVTATGYYPSSWTSVPSSIQYGGVITWKVGGGLRITAQPVSRYAAAGKNAVFTVAAAGSNLSYQWQVYSDGTWVNSGMTGNKTSSLTVPVITARNGLKYRCIVKNSDGDKVVSNAAALTVFGITSQPVNKTEAVDKNVVFYVSAIGKSLTYQWYWRKSSTETWAVCGLTGNKTSSLTIGASTARNGYQYRCVITDGNGNKITSNTAVLTIVPGITSQPASVMAAAGAKAVFNVIASGTGLTYQWQYRSSSSGTWANTALTGNRTSSLTVEALPARNGFQYRCIVTDGNKKSAVSSAATLKVKVVITQQPSTITKNAGTNAAFKVTAVGNSLKYQWYWRSSSAGTWAVCGLTGNKTASLTVGAITERNGYQYRCLITDVNGNKVTSSTAILSVIPRITTQPVSITKSVGTNAVFKIAAAGTGLTYQWYWRSSSAGTWAVCGLSGNKTATLTVGAITARNGYQYRCVVTDRNNKKVTSNAATLTIASELSIVTNPASVSASVGSTARFNVKATGIGLKYQWYWRSSSAGTWAATGFTGNRTSTLSVPVIYARNGYQYRCEITDSSGDAIISRAATLTVLK